MLREHIEKNNTFIISEVGQNHQGDLETARKFIRTFAYEGADAVKFQTRNNRVLFSEDAYNANYTSLNAFAEKYGEHREKLELNPEWLPILKKDCEDFGVKFMSTPFDEESVDLLMDVGVDLFKIASFDLGNLPLINRIASTGKPVVMSIGGGKSDQISASVDLILKHGTELAILHCVSEYPCEYNRLGLSNIPLLQEQFPSCIIGSSDHFNGILSGPVAYMMGARVFEKHVTLNRAWKGTDHSFSLEPDGFRKFVRDIKRTPYMLPMKPNGELGNEKVFFKLGKSLVAAKEIQVGEIFSLENLTGKIFKEFYVPVRESNKVIGKSSKRNIKAGEPLANEDFN